MKVKRKPSKKRTHSSTHPSAQSRAGRANLLPQETKKRVLNYLRELGRRAISIHDLIKELRLPADDARPLRQFLKSLVKQGRLDTRRRGKYILTQNIHEPMLPDAPVEAPKARRSAFAPDWEEHEAPAASQQPLRRKRRRRDDEGEAKPWKGDLLLPAALGALDVEAFPLEVIQEAEEASRQALEVLGSGTVNRKERQVT